MTASGKRIPEQRKRYSPDHRARRLQRQLESLGYKGARTPSKAPMTRRRQSSRFLFDGALLDVQSRLKLSYEPLLMLADAIAALGDEMVRVPAGEPVHSS